MKNLWSSIKDRWRNYLIIAEIDKETFGDIETEKCDFRHCKNLIFLEDVDVNGIPVFGMNSLGGKVKILRLMLPKTSTCVKNYDGVGGKHQYGCKQDKNVTEHKNQGLFE